MSRNVLDGIKALISPRPYFKIFVPAHYKLETMVEVYGAVNIFLKHLTSTHDRKDLAYLKTFLQFFLDLKLCHIV